MRKISLTTLTLFFQVLSAFSQADSAAYRHRKLHVDEINFLQSYYVQDGNNSAVTGGIGTEKLTNFGNTLEVKLIHTDKRDRLRTLTVEAGFDHYSSASSDKIDPNTISSASSADGRFYPSVAYSVNDKQKGLTFGSNVSYSIESDYQSYGMGVNLAKRSMDKNREIGVKLQAFFDTWVVLYPIELRYIYGNGHDQPRNSYNTSFYFSQVINKRLQWVLLADVGYQEGLLATRFQRVYFNNSSEKPEDLPSQRLKLPIGLRASYFLGDRFILRFFYRYYYDNWGINGHTANLEVPVIINPFLSFSGFYRYYTQTAARYFAPYKQHDPSDAFYTSDYDLSEFNSHFYGVDLRIMPKRGLFGIKHFTMLELRYGHYVRSNGLSSDIISMNARFK